MSPLSNHPVRPEKPSIEIGATYAVVCPFVRDVFSNFDEDGYFTSLTWKPGIVWEICGYGDSTAVAHGIGQVVYHVVDVHQLPRPYPARVFFTRKWTSPDGRSFGRSKLHILTKDAFRRRLVGYRYAGFEDDGFTVRDLDQDERVALLKKAA